MLVEILYLLAGLVCGFGIMTIVYNRKAAGELLVNTTDPDGPYLFLKLKDSPNTIMRQKYVTFIVNVKNNTSRK